MSPDVHTRCSDQVINRVTWIQSYLEALEDLPYRMEHHLSQVLLLDSHFCGGISQVEGLEEKFGSCDEDDSKQCAKMQQKTYDRMKFILAHLQLIADKKLDELAEVSEMLDVTLQKFATNPETSGSEQEKKVALENKRSEEKSESCSPVTQNNGVNCSGNEKDKQVTRKATKKYRRRFCNDFSHDGDSSDKAEKPHNAGTGCHRKRKKQKADEESRGVRFDMPIDPNEPTYCLCEQVSYGEMICCDNTNCLIEWFHFNCVDLITKPKGKWYCPNCRGDRPNVLKSRS